MHHTLLAATPIRKTSGRSPQTFKQNSTVRTSGNTGQEQNELQHVVCWTRWQRDILNKYFWQLQSCHICRTGMSQARQQFVCMSVSDYVGFGIRVRLLMTACDWVLLVVTWALRFWGYICCGSWYLVERWRNYPISDVSRMLMAVLWRPSRGASQFNVAPHRFAAVSFHGRSVTGPT